MSPLNFYSYILIAVTEQDSAGAQSPAGLSVFATTRSGFIWN